MLSTLEMDLRLRFKRKESRIFEVLKELAWVTLMGI